MFAYHTPVRICRSCSHLIQTNQFDPGLSLYERAKQQEEETKRSEPKATTVESGQWIMLDAKDQHAYSDSDHEEEDEHHDNHDKDMSRLVQGRMIHVSSPTTTTTVTTSSMIQVVAEEVRNMKQVNDSNLPMAQSVIVIDQQGQEEVVLPSAPPAPEKES